MASTPNFNWATPDNTGLVKNGALDIRTLGNAIDASMVDLKGGTTGQVLTKASNTDMDFSWTAASGGSNQFYAGKNKIINGDFRINQRNFTSNTASGSFNFDRWFQDNDGGTVTCTPQTFTPGTAPVSGYEGSTFLRQVVASQSTSAQYAQIRQKIESVRSFAGQTVTLSFWAKAASGTPKIAPMIQQDFGAGGGSANVNTVGSSVTLSTSWARYSVTVSIPSLSGKTIGTSNADFLSITLWTSAGSTYNSLTNSLGLQNNTFDIWGVQLEAGSTATDFQTATGNIASELAACQRYYQRITASNSYGIMGTALGYNGTTAYGIFYPKVNLRDVTAIDYSSLALIQSAGALAITSLTIQTNYTSNGFVGLSIGIASGGTADRAYAIQANNSGTAYLGISGEL